MTVVRRYQVGGHESESKRLPIALARYDAFRTPGVTVAIRVGEDPASAAAWCLRAQDEVDELLRALIHERRHLDGRNERVEGLLRAVRR
jgi:hypothetical protein